MGLFGFGKKKNTEEEPKDEVVEETTEVEEESSPEESTEESSAEEPKKKDKRKEKSDKMKEKKKKKKDTMASILSESVVESAIATMQENQRFIVTRDNEPQYMVLFLRAEDIGGISKKSAKDEAKGQIVEQINSNRISTLITAEMLDNEELVIIPNALTLESMEEFSILQTAPYELRLMKADGALEDSGLTVDLDTVIKYANAKPEEYTPIHFLANLGAEWAQKIIIEESGQDEETPIITAGLSDEVKEDVTFDPRYDIPPEEQEIPNDDELPFGMDAMTEGNQDFQQEMYYDQDAAPEPEPEIETTQEEFNGALIRKFYSDNLGLEVSTDAFDTIFLSKDTFVPFDEQRAGMWLDQYLNQMSREANLELYNMHVGNLSRMRERFFVLLSAYAEKIQRELDYRSEESAYYQYHANLEDMNQERMENLDRAIAEKRNKVIEDWNNTLAKIGTEAAQAAQMKHRERFGRKHDQDLMDVDITLKREAENEYQADLKQMHDERRDIASKKLDYAITETLEKVSKEYEDLLEEERKAYIFHRDRIAEYLDQNRKDDVAREQTLAEELRQSEKADKVLQEQVEKMKQQAAEFELQKNSLREEIERLQRQTENQLKLKDEDCRRQVSSANERADNLQSDFDRLFEKYEILDENKKKEYESKITEMLNEKQVWEDKCSHIVQVHKKSNAVAIVLAVVSVVAALAVGVVVGLKMNYNYSSDRAKDAIINELNERIGEIDGKHVKKEELDVDKDKKKPELNDLKLDKSKVKEKKPGTDAPKTETAPDSTAPAR